MAFNHPLDQGQSLLAGQRAAAQCRFPLQRLGRIQIDPRARRSEQAEKIRANFAKEIRGKHLRSTFRTKRAAAAMTSFAGSRKNASCRPPSPMPNTLHQMQLTP